MKKNISIFIAVAILLSYTTGVVAANYIHEPYINGYGNGYFGPENILTRAEAIHIFAQEWVKTAVNDSKLSFCDVSEKDWFYGDLKKAVNCGYWEDGVKFEPSKPITRAELAKMASHLCRIKKYPGNIFSDVDISNPYADSIYTVYKAGWMQGYKDGSFKPQKSVTRAETVAFVNRVFGFYPDKAAIDKHMKKISGYFDVTPDKWYYYDVYEASLKHEMYKENTKETWVSCLSDKPFSISKGPYSDIGFWMHDNDMYYVNWDGFKLKNATRGVFRADSEGRLTKFLSEYSTDVPYLSQIDNIYAWVGCEPTAALAGLWAKGYAKDISLKYFLDNIPKTTENPEIGFVGDPYTPDPSKKKRTTIYPAKLAEYCNSYCDGRTPCADIRGYTAEQLQNELLMGNYAVAYMTLRWEPIYYRDFLIDGKIQRLVSNNHAVLVCGYSSEKGYRISDPYNEYTPGKAYQYWIDAEKFENIWNERKVAMIIR